jgi:hypothetical protein
MNPLFGHRTIESLEQRLVALERRIGELRAEQAVLVNEVDKRNGHRSDGSRTLAEWLQIHLDVSKDTALALVVAGRGCVDNRMLQEDLADEATFDRVVAMHRFVDAGATEVEARSTLTLNISDLQKMTRNRRRLVARDERREFADRYVSLQPTLDRTAWTLSGRLPGVMGKLVEEALHRRADEHRLLPDGDRGSLGQRRADALVTVCQDAIAGKDDSHASPGDEAGSRDQIAGTVTVFVDARTENPVEAASEIAFGPRVGQATLEALLCGGSVRVVGMDGATPVSTSPTTRTIRPATRDAVLFRDGGCSIDGCASTYRLEPHHIVSWSRGGSHSLENLTTLCWYHHHIAIHGEGFTIDVASPPGRRRLVRGSPNAGHLAA